MTKSTIIVLLFFAVFISCSCLLYTSGMGNFMVGATQMIPNPKKQMADFNYMNAMSSVEKENKNYTLNQLYACLLYTSNSRRW